MKSILLFFLALLVSCEDSNLNDFACNDIYAPVLARNGKTYSNDCYAKEGGGVDAYLQRYYWDQTQCADPWYSDVLTKQDIEYLKDFLDGLSTNYYELEKIEESDLPLNCRACTCGTGFRFVFLAKIEDNLTLDSIGFKSNW